jgi:Hpt domain
MQATDRQEDLIRRHFDGDRALHAEYLGLCRAQFLVDAQTGDAACANDDDGLPPLRRLMHSLKTVLQTLGADEVAQQARDVELACLAQDAQRAHATWQQVRLGMLAV